MRKLKKHWKEAAILLLVAIAYTLLVKWVDVGAIGPGKTKVGWQILNGFFHNLIGKNMFFYQLTKYLGVIPFLIVAFYGLIGVKQLIEKKSLKKVDKRIIALGVFYVVVGLVYIFFEKVVINCRPVILDGVIEPSYPSSHTMLALCICLSSILISKYYIKNEKIRKIVDYATIALMIILVVGRILSGVHWITDIIGGILISLALVSIYKASIQEEEEII